MVTMVFGGYLILTLEIVSSFMLAIVTDLHLPNQNRADSGNKIKGSPSSPRSPCQVYVIIEGGGVVNPYCWKWK